MKRKPETDWVNYWLDRAAAAWPGVWWRQNSGTKGHVKFSTLDSAPDIMGVKRGDGRFVAIEVKHESRLTAGQYDTLSRFKNCGADVFVAAKSDLFVFGHDVPARYLPV